MAIDRGGQQPQEFTTIDIVYEERALSHAAHRHVVDRSAKLDSVSARHARSSFKSRAEPDLERLGQFPKSVGSGVAIFEIFPRRRRRSFSAVHWGLWPRLSVSLRIGV
jgi:hypothetical protein